MQVGMQGLSRHRKTTLGALEAAPVLFQMDAESSSSIVGEAQVNGTEHEIRQAPMLSAQGRKPLLNDFDEAAAQRKAIEDAATAIVEELEVERHLLMRGDLIALGCFTLVLFPVCCFLLSLRACRSIERTKCHSMETMQCNNMNRIDVCESLCKNLVEDRMQKTTGAETTVATSRSPVAETPAPVARLLQTGTSFMVPLSRIVGCSDKQLAFDVPCSSNVWPLSASLSRSDVKHAWTHVQLTVDVLDAAGMPPLLVCHSTDSTAGTGKSKNNGDTALGEFTVHDSSGYSVAIAAFGNDYSGAIRRDGKPPWRIERRLDGTHSCSVAISKQSQDIAIGTLSASGESTLSEKFMQVDVQPVAESPESILLLMCMLAMVVFEPEALPVS